MTTEETGGKKECEKKPGEPIGSEVVEIRNVYLDMSVADSRVDNR